MINQLISTASANGDLVGVINNFDPFVIVKWFIVVGLAMYAFFALVVLKQVGIMTETFESEVNFAVKLFAWLHLFLAVFLIIIALLL